MSNGASRRKGKAGELEVVHDLSSLGVPARRLWEDQSKKGGQQNGDISIDLYGWEDVYYTEVRRRERMEVPRWMEECDEKSAAVGRWPLLIVRRNRMPWWACVRLNHLTELWREK